MIPILITSPKIPKVSILKGRVNILKIGLIKKLISPKKRPANNKILTSPLKYTLGTNLIANQSPKIPAIIWKIIEVTIN